MQAAETAPRRQVKRDTILEVARRTFLNEGYAATSMSQIAAELGGSKGTLYNYFPSKEALFAAVMRDHCERAQALMRELELEAGELRDRLQRFGEAFLRKIMSEDFLAMYRLVTAESARVPEIGVAFYEAGPKEGMKPLVRFFEREMAAGTLRQADPARAANQFLELCRSDIYRKRLWNVIGHPTPAEIAEEVEIATDAFMRIYAPR